MKKLILAMLISCLSTTSIADSDDLANVVNELDFNTIEQYSAKDLSPNRYETLSPHLERWLEDMPIVKGDNNNQFMAKSLVGDGEEEKIAVVLKVDNNDSTISRILEEDGIQAQVGNTIYTYVSKNTLKELAQQEELLGADLQPTLSYKSNLSDIMDRYREDKKSDNNNNAPTTDNSSTDTQDSNNNKRRSQHIGQGAAITEVGFLHQKGIKGRGIKIGILDFGFSNYEKLQAQGIVPKVRSAMSFAQQQKINGISDNGEVHGTACAEIIHQMAPDAELYLAQVGAGGGTATTGDVIAAAKWLISQGVDIINFSGGGFQEPLNGTSDLDKIVDASSKNNNILWTISSGNEGDSHWSGMLIDRNQNGLVDITENGSGDFLKITCAKNSCSMLVTVNIDDWPNTPNRSANIGLKALLITADAQGNLVNVANANLERKGSASSAQVSFGKQGLPRGEYALVLQAPSNVGHIKAHVFLHNDVSSVTLDTKNKFGSLTAPGTSRQALTVGAYDVNKATIADYSSHGPTDDGRTKPDISAPAGVKSLAYNKSAFHGTSAAAPHAAGFAALIKQKDKLSGVSLKNTVMKSVKKINQVADATGQGLIYAKSANVGKQDFVEADEENNITSGQNSSNLINNIQDILQQRK